MIKYALGLLFLVIFLLSGSTISAQQPIDKPIKIELQNLQVSQGTITANIGVTNPNPIDYRDINYVVKLQGEDVVEAGSYKGEQVTTISQGPLINYQKSDNFALAALGNKSFPLRLAYGSALTPGNYKLQISLSSSNDQLLGSALNEVKLQGNGNFLEIKNCVVVVDGVEYDPIIGPNVAPKGEVYGKCSAKNLGASGISAYPQADYAVDSVVDSSVKQTLSGEKALTFPGGSTSNIIFPLPALEKPQVYEALAFLKNNQGEVVSSRVAFRWVIAGQSSLIRSISSDKSEYKKGETAKVTVGADPSMDLFWKGGGPTKDFANISATSPVFVLPGLQGTPLKDAEISVVMKSGAGQVCGSKGQKVNINPEQNIWPDQSLDVVMENDCTNPTIMATVKSDGVELASKEVKVPVLVKSEQIQKRAQDNFYAWVIAGVLLAALIAAGLFYYWKKKKLPPIKPPTSAALTVLVVMLALAHSGLAFDGFPSLIKPACAQSASASPSAQLSPTPSPSSTASASPISQTGKELGPGQNVSIHYEGIKAYRPNQACPGPQWKIDGNVQPQYSDGAGGCVLDMVSGFDETNFTFLDTRDQMTFTNNQIQARISGQFRGFGCSNTRIGLIVRAYVNGTNQGVKINGGSSKAVFSNLAQNGGGNGGTNVDLPLTITPGGVEVCGPQNVKLELIPFIEHMKIATSDLAEDNLIKDADVPGWTNVTYINRQNCGVSGQSCWGVLQKTVDTGNCPGCNVTCQRDDQCKDAKDGCTSCVNNSCQKVPVCGNVCSTPADCVNARDGCTQCLPSTGGTATGSASTLTCQPPPPPACNAFCADSKDCVGNKEGCSECVAGQCRVPPACNVACTKDGQCTGAKDGCTVCLPADSGVGSVCKPPPACNVACQRDDQCAGAKDGCTLCIDNVCKKPPACNDTCTKASDCARAADGCTQCLPSDTGTGNVCRPTPACGIACTKDGQCAGAKDGCTVCMGGVCKPPPSCGTACTTKADCANPKDGCSECLEGTCTDYSANMCKCDGILADLTYPSNAFKFEAFGKVEGTDTKKAEIADITFRMTKDNLVIAKSNPIKPEIVQNDPTKVRFKAAWQTPPPPVSKTATFQVFADVRCKPKKIIASANQDFTPNPDAIVESKKLPPPKGLELIASVVNKLFGQGSELITKEALAQFSLTSPTPTQAESNLQLKTLNFIKMLNTDNCRFVMWKFDETLF